MLFGNCCGHFRLGFTVLGCEDWTAVGVYTGDIGENTGLRRNIVSHLVRAYSGSNDGKTCNSSKPLLHVPFIRNPCLQSNRQIVISELPVQ